MALNSLATACSLSQRTTGLPSIGFFPLRKCKRCAGAWERTSITSGSVGIACFGSSLTSTCCDGLCNQSMRQTRRRALELAGEALPDVVELTPDHSFQG